MNHFKHCLLSVLCLGLFLSSATAKVAASDTMSIPTEETVKAPETLVGEVTEKREVNIKTFLTSEYRYQAYIYPNAVHYKVNGKYADIDNRLVESQSDNTLLENTANSFKIKFAKNTNASKIVSFSAGTLGFSWRFVGINKTFVSIDNNESRKQDTLTDISNTQSMALYSDAFLNTDLQYILDGDKLKENFILKAKGAPSTFTQSIAIQQGSVTEENGKIVFKDKDGVVQYIMGDLSMSDASGEFSDKVTYSYVKTIQGIDLTITADPTWINDASRVYPITIDPSVQTSLDRAMIEDVHVSSGMPTTYFGGHYIVKSGYGATSKINYSYLRFTLPVLTSSDLVIDARLEMYVLSSATVDPTNVQVNVYEVTSGWTENGINWNSKPSNNPIIEDYDMVAASEWVYWDITRLTKKWYTTGNNDGVLIKNQVETANYKEYYSADTSGTWVNYRPNIVITYVNNNGLESYWNYHTQSVGRAGTGYVNDYNGNLVFIHGDTSNSGNLPSVSVSHIYNSGDALNTSKYSPGWRINYAQTITEKSFTIDTVTTDYCLWSDEDGTTHYFKEETTDVYKDENGSGLTITKNGTTGYDMTDTSDNVSHFDASGKLLTIKNSYNQTITITYNADSTINTITDAASRVTTFAYSGGNLSSITDHYGKATTFSYTNTTIDAVVYPLLTQITDFEGKHVFYNYDSSGYLTAAKNFDNYEINYTFATNKPYRVTKIQEKNGTTIGNKLDLVYGGNQTTYTDSYNATLIEQFDDTGKTVNLQDGLGNAQYFEHGTGVNINNLTNSSKLQTTIVNLLTNGSAELTGSWTYVEAASGDSGSFSTAYSYYGAKSFQIIKTGTTGSTKYYQTLALTKGKTFTFSAYAYANNPNSKLLIQYRDANNVLKEVYSTFAFTTETTENWTRQEVSFTLPIDAYTTSVSFCIVITNGTGTTYFDALQVEEGTVANRPNLVENSDFRNGTTGWSTSGFVTGDGVTTTSDSRPSNLSNNVLSVTGGATLNKYIYQDLGEGGLTGDCFVIGGWAKGNSVATTIDTSRHMGMLFKFHYTDGTDQWIGKDFNVDSYDWQYLSYEVVAPKNYTTVRVYFYYKYEANSVTFDGAALYKEKFGTSYVYYSDTGRLKSVSDLEGKITSYEYDNENNLSKITRPDSSDYEYNYNSYHDIIATVSDMGVTNDIMYDSLGNTSNSSVTTNNYTIKSSTAYTSNGLYTANKTDALGNTVEYDTSTDGTLNSVEDPLGNVTNYTYDSTSKKLTKVSTTLNGTEVANTYTYDNDKLKTISHNGFSYTFNYDTFGNVTSVQVGTVTLSSNTYNSYGRLDRTDYGNSQYITYSYDAAQRVIGISVGGTERFTYEYDASGNLARINNKQNSTSVRYVYDLSNRLVQVIQSNGNITSFTYDQANNASVVNEVINSTTFKTTYTFDSDMKLTNVKDSLNFNTIYGYDSFGRLTSKVFKDASLASKFTTNYTYTNYTNDGVNYTSAQLATITNGSSTISYLYDANGNITSINEGGNVTQYFYDALGQVIRENNQRDTKTYTWEYDFGGNILSKKTYDYSTGSLDGLTPTTTDTYAYTNTNWKDQLTLFNGNTITYDVIGNPTAYNGRTFTWDKGRQLSSITATGLSVSYTYNDSGIRTSKTVNGVTTNYQLNGDKVSYEKTGSVYSYYTYDSNGQLVSINYNGAEYYYIRNGQNDIIGLVNSSGTVVVNYTYSTWGEVLSTTGTLASTLGAANPYRYRGYRFDSETGYYYLQSRYFDSLIGRFINADSSDMISSISNDLTQINLYTYAINNPVNNVDPNGNWVLGAFLTGFFGALSLVLAAYNLFNGIKGFMSLNDPKQIYDILIYAIGAGMFVGLPSCVALFLQTVVMDYGPIIYSIIVTGNVAMYSFPGTFTFKFILDLCAGIGSAFLPDIVTSGKMIIAAIHGKSYKFEAGGGWWRWRWRWLPV
jgi:RHS repeat-associated protein